ncbi:hypothetical protein LEP1GSC088_4730 [Leptospira interrogans str. L1207]|nr:hypothetical protein LEP1GSC088_4730 [Leptospira interrogans str. L1207]
MIHHIAIGSPNIETLEKFYESPPGLKKIRISLFDPFGLLRVIRF